MKTVMLSLTPMEDMYHAADRNAQIVSSVCRVKMDIVYVGNDSMESICIPPTAIRGVVRKLRRRGFVVKASTVNGEKTLN